MLRRVGWLVVSLVLNLPIQLDGQTMAENAAAFAGSADITRESFHWDSVGGTPPEPQVATTPRTVLPGADLTTLIWDPSGRPDIYQEKTFGSTVYQSTLVVTFTKPFSMWNGTPGSEVTLTFDNSGTTNYILPYVTSGNELRDYLRATYFDPTDSPDPAEIALRIQQAVGLPAEDASDRGLAYFWAPLQNIARPAYSADITTQLPTLDTFSDGTYQTTTVGAPDGFTYVDVNDAATTYTGPAGLPDFVTWNQAQTTYPWTAMGYTYNWNALQDGSNPAYGFDPDHATSTVGLSEFIISGGSDVILENWIPYSDFTTWLVPEPSAALLLVLAAGLLLIRLRRHRPCPCRTPVTVASDTKFSK